MVTSLLTGSRTDQESKIEERIRTLSQAICALGVVGAALYFLRSVLVPLVLAVALKYCLQPLISLLSVRPLECCGLTFCRRSRRSARRSCLMAALCELRLPHWLAVLVSLALAFMVLGLIGFIVADSVNVFTRKAPIYSERVQVLAAGLLDWVDAMQVRVGFSATNSSAADGAYGVEVGTADRLKEIAKKLPISSVVLGVLTSLLDTVSNLALVLLFTIYLLASSGGGGSPTADETATASAPAGAAGGDDGDDGAGARAEIEAEAEARNEALAKAEAEKQILMYIRGKVLLSLMVGLLTALSLSVLRVELALVFGILAFWLNFIPNVGTVVAVALPMPLVLLDERFTPLTMALALLLPLGAHTLSGSVLEPLLFGKTLKLHPVVILLSLLLWASVWGITGMVLAVPLTAVLRIRLAAVHHPLPQFLAAALVGDTAAPARGFDEGRLPLMADDGAAKSSAHEAGAELLPIAPARPARADGEAHAPACNV